MYEGMSRCLLDRACSAGTVLELAQESDRSVFDVRPSGRLLLGALACFGARVLSTGFEKVRLARQCLDTMTFGDVLEHVADPVAVLNMPVRLWHEAAFSH